jgi:sec-independent protein translocase protein TatA
MPNVGWQGLVVLGIVALLIFGPKRLPEIGRSLGKGLRDFKSAVSGEDEKDEAAPAESENATTKPVSQD